MKPEEFKIDTKFKNEVNGSGEVESVIKVTEFCVYTDKQKDGHHFNKNSPYAKNCILIRHQKESELQVRALEWITNYIKNDFTYLVVHRNIVHHEFLTIKEIVKLYLEINKQ